MKKLFAFLLFTVLSLGLLAQEKEPEMADTFRSSGKIFVVVAVAGIVLAGLIVYLVLIDRKVGKLEKEVFDRNKKN